MYGHVITKFSGMDRFTFPWYCACALRARESSSSKPLVTPWHNVYACARLSISGLFFSHTFQSDRLPRALMCAACGSVVLLHAARVSDHFVVIEIAFMDNQAQVTETIIRLDSEKVR